MRDMKDSGVEWLAEIPVTWDLVQLGSLFSEHKHKNTGMQSENLLSLSYGNIIRKDINTSDGLLPESFEGYNVIDDGDSVLRLTDLQNDQRSLRVGLSHERGIVTSAYVTLRKRNAAINSKFYYYLIHSYDVRKGFYGMGAGVRQGLNYAGCKKIMLTLPPVDEQERIVAILDDKLPKVDVLIANVQAQIEKLKAYKQSVITEVVTKGLDPTVPMKDSGVEWIGEIPEHWSLTRIKFICDTFGRIGFRGYTTDDFVPEGEGAITLSPSNFSDMKMNYSKCSYLSWDKYNESPEIQIKNGDVLFVKTGSTYGKSCLVHDLPCEATINPQSIVFKNFKSDARLFCYFLNSVYAYWQVEQTVVGGTIPTIAQSKIINYIIVLPDEQSQPKIVAYLDKKCTQIDHLIAIKQKKIDKLNEYKKSLIYEYVTGKKEVS